ncbi:DUF4144 family protein [Thalassotalea ponticola]|uniref:DUF4144 family protein n=1 Tax=Thalassotalea ponticola TaxID=1523392 RepID=UPI0025B3E35D|nr:DUF4144 family protein [Thalassotalea ponticola]MDN3652301.1 DUF4144 family protein [Thalassotalea ponticola]
MINWPAIIKHDGEDELIYIANREQWLNDEEMLLYFFTDADVLIDSLGQVFSLPEVQSNIDSANVLAVATVDQIMELVRAHAALLAHCCVAKIGADNTEQAIELVKSMSEDTNS